MGRQNSVSARRVGNHLTIAHVANGQLCFIGGLVRWTWLLVLLCQIQALVQEPTKRNRIIDINVYGEPALHANALIIIIFINLYDSAAVTTSWWVRQVFDGWTRLLRRHHHNNNDDKSKNDHRCERNHEGKKEKERDCYHIARFYITPFVPLIYHVHVPLPS